MIFRTSALALLAYACLTGVTYSAGGTLRLETRPGPQFAVRNTGGEAVTIGMVLINSRQECSLITIDRSDGAGPVMGPVAGAFGMLTEPLRLEVGEAFDIPETPCSEGGSILVSIDVLGTVDGQLESSGWSFKP